MTDYLKNLTDSIPNDINKVDTEDTYRASESQTKRLKVQNQGQIHQDR